MPAGYIDDDSGVSYMVSVGQKFESSGELADMCSLTWGWRVWPPSRWGRSHGGGDG